MTGGALYLGVATLLVAVMAAKGAPVPQWGGPPEGQQWTRPPPSYNAPAVNSFKTLSWM